LQNGSGGKLFLYWMYFMLSRLWHIPPASTSQTLYIFHFAKFWTS
jgi:hypothetical protein